MLQWIQPQVQLPILWRGKDLVQVATNLSNLNNFVTVITTISCDIICQLNSISIAQPGICARKTFGSSLQYLTINQTKEIKEHPGT